MLAVNKRTGALVWITTVDDHPAAVITQSAVASGDRVYLAFPRTRNPSPLLPIIPAVRFAEAYWRLISATAA